MPIWDEGQLDTLAAATARARAGDPTLLVIEGEAGTGKTTLLAELADLTQDFHRLAAEGLEYERFPFSLLAQWGVDLPPAEGSQPAPFVAAQAIRESLDGLAETGPVLLLVEDLHWAEPESVEALCWLLRRAAGDRLLIAVTTRPLAADLHPGWQRWVAGPGHALMVRLTGLSQPAAVTLIRRRHPDMSPGSAQRLWEHTSGNPLFLTALLDEYDAAELTRMRVLPAPAEFARLLGERVDRLPDSAVDLLRATAVLGTGWFALPEVAIVAESAHPAEAAQLLSEAGLMQSRSPVGVTSIRLAHALVGAAVYQQTPLPKRRELHQRAAGVMTARSAVLEHRMAAAEQYDDELAEAMDAYARDRYEARSFRLAAQYLRWSSALTRDPAGRERRWLESLFSSALARDLPAVHADLADVGRASDTLLAAMIIGNCAVAERRPRDAIATLEPAAQRLIAGADVHGPMDRYRIHLLLAWARLCAAHPTELVAAELNRANELGVRDAGISGLALMIGGQVNVRQYGIGAVLEGLAGAPGLVEDPQAVPEALTTQLAFRGTMRARSGQFRESVSDLTEATGRLQRGVDDFGRGSFHATLASGQWMRGDWSRARISIALALDISEPFFHPMVLALAPLMEIGDGRFEEADALLARAAAGFEAEPWPEARQLFLGTRVIDAHARGSAAAKAALLAELRPTVLDANEVTPLGPMGIVHLGLAAVWARDPDYADRLAAQLPAVRPQAPWIPTASRWLSGLIAESRGKGTFALRELTAAVADHDFELPLYRAHMLADHARVASLLGDPAAAERSLARAEEIYRRLGARPYVERITRLRADPQAAKPAAVYPLTDRERDVLTLLAAGMSYAQIARDLFITQRTVGYHLSNIYGKAGVNSRHQLTELARREPLRFGLVATA